jgi:hypothetical protein
MNNYIKTRVNEFTVQDSIKLGNPTQCSFNLTHLLPAVQSIMPWLWPLLSEYMQVHQTLPGPTSGKRREPTQALKGTVKMRHHGGSPSGGGDHSYSGQVWKAG